MNDLEQRQIRIDALSVIIDCAERQANSLKVSNAALALEILAESKRLKKKCADLIYKLEYFQQLRKDRQSLPMA